MFLDLSRTRGPFSVLIATAIALGCYGLLINTAIGRDNRWLLERDQTGMTPTKIGPASRRLVGILRERESGAEQPGARTGILIGASVLQYGISPTLLASEIGGNYRWSNFVVSGNPNEFNLITKVMYQSGVNPDVLVLVLNPSTMLPLANFEEEHIWYDPRILRQHITQMQIGYVRDDLVEMTLVPWNLAFPYRGQVFTLADRSLLAAKLRMLDALGLGMAGLYPPSPDPWYEDDPIMSYEPSMTEEAQKNFLKHIENKGWFDPARYRSDGPNFALLMEIFRLAHAHGTRSFMVFVPESEVLQAKLPPDADYHLTHTLKDTLGPAAPTILDLRDAIPGEEFFDPAHVKPVGAKRFTKSLADVLKPYLSGK